MRTKMKSFFAPWVLLEVLWIVILQSDEIHGKTISQNTHDLDERMVRNRTRIFNLLVNKRKNNRGPLQNPTKPVRTTEDVETQSKEASAENPLSILETDLALNASSPGNSTSSETEVKIEDEDEEVLKFSSSNKGDEITMEHVDFVMLRLQHISRSVSNNLTEILALQKKEFKLNPKYKEGWLYSQNNSTQLVKTHYKELGTIPNFLGPEEYHIAVTAYTNAYPEGEGNAMYYDFNKATRDVCSGKDVDKYHYKSFFKLLELAIKELNKEPKLRDSNRFLYRGIKRKFKLKQGQVLAFQQFVSTSTDLDVAEKFAGDQTLLEIQGYYDTGLNVELHSQYTEGEILFYPLQVFKVDSIHVGKYYTRYVLVGHKWEGIGGASNGKGCIGVEGNDVDVKGKATAEELRENEQTTNKQVTIIPPSFVLLVGIISTLISSN